MFCPKHLILFLTIIAKVSLTAAQQASSQRVGYNNAKALWEGQTYKCSLDGVLEFWEAVKAQTFKDCDKTYFLNQQRIEACKEGAATYVREKAETCSQESDCQMLGDLAAAAVSQKFCFLVTNAAIPDDFFPPACQRTANRQCNIEGKLAIQDLANQGQCGSISLVLTEAQNLALQSECRELVRDWARTSLLPFP